MLETAQKQRAPSISLNWWNFSCRRGPEWQLLIGDRGLWKCGNLLSEPCTHPLPNYTLNSAIHHDHREGNLCCLEIINIYSLPSLTGHVEHFNWTLAPTLWIFHGNFKLSVIKQESSEEEAMNEEVRRWWILVGCDKWRGSDTSDGGTIETPSCLG